MTPTPEIGLTFTPWDWVHPHSKTSRTDLQPTLLPFNPFGSGRIEPGRKRGDPTLGCERVPGTSGSRDLPSVAVGFVWGFRNSLGELEVTDLTGETVT